MVGVVNSIPSGGNFIFADFETPRCQFCTKMPEMSNLYYLGKTRIHSSCDIFIGDVNTRDGYSETLLFTYLAVPRF